MYDHLHEKLVIAIESAMFDEGSRSLAESMALLVGDLESFRSLPPEARRHRDRALAVLATSEADEAHPLAKSEGTMFVRIRRLSTDEKLELRGALIALLLEIHEHQGAPLRFRLRAVCYA